MRQLRLGKFDVLVGINLRLDVMKKLKGAGGGGKPCLSITAVTDHTVWVDMIHMAARYTATVVDLPQ